MSRILLFSHFYYDCLNPNNLISTWTTACLVVKGFVNCSLHPYLLSKSCSSYRNTNQIIPCLCLKPSKSFTAYLELNLNASLWIPKLDMLWPLASPYTTCLLTRLTHTCACFSLTASALGFSLSGMLFPRSTIHNSEVAIQSSVTLAYFRFQHSAYH